MVQIQDDQGVVVYNREIRVSLYESQPFSPTISWIPTAPGTYTVTAFVWVSLDNPIPLSPPLSITVDVN